MKIAIIMDILEDGRGISKVINKLLTHINYLYPSLEIYLIASKHAKKIINHNNFKIISRNIQEVLYYKIDYVLAPVNGFYLEEFIHPKIKIINFLHDIIPLAIDSVNGSTYNKMAENNKSIMAYLQNQINNTNILLTVSEFSKQDILKHLKVSKNLPINIIPLAPMLEYDKFQSNKEEDYFIYCGGNCPRKGIFQLVNNFLQARIRGYIKSKLILVGLKNKNSKYKDVLYLPKLVDLIKLGERLGYIDFLDYVSDTELAKLIANAKAMIYPSLYEGFGIPIVDAMALGCPVLTTRLSSIPEVAEDAAYYIDSNNEIEFQKALYELENNNELRKKLIKKGKERVKDFSWENSSKKFIKILEDYNTLNFNQQ